MYLNSFSKELAMVILGFSILAILNIGGDRMSIMNAPANAEVDNSHSSDNDARIGIEDIHTVPNTIHIGDTFKIAATITNNSTNTIVFAKACGPIASATFDGAVTTENATVCNILIAPAHLSPGQKTTIEIPGSFGGMFKAIQAGRVHSELVFPYRIEGEPMSINNATASYTFQINN
jgi:hypothetical protein